MTTPAQWIAGARPRTLPAAIAPVLAGTAAAELESQANWMLAGLALLVALGLQIGVNYANDYSDGIRGTDSDRVGPMRLTGSGAAPAVAVKRAAFISLGFAAVVGLLVIALSGTWWLLIVGAAALVAAWYYTGGSSPYGYSGWGEVAVFIFFGLVAVLGTQYTQILRISWVGFFSAVGIGALACALLVANNLRDIPTDELSNKVTLAVRLGDARTRSLYIALIGLAAVMGLASAWHYPSLILSVPALFAAWPSIKAIRCGASGSDLLPVLGNTGKVELLYALGLSLGAFLPGLVLGFAL